MNLRPSIKRLAADVARLRDETAVADVPCGGPADLMRSAGMEPDRWQLDMFDAAARQILLLVTRQGGKSTSTAARALAKAQALDGALVLLIAPSLRQSQELFASVSKLYSAGRRAGSVPVPVPVDNHSTLRATFANGSRIIALPGDEKTIRGYSGVDLLIIDEASRVLDALYYSVRPMLAVSGGELVLLTTPWGRRGFFYQEWTEGGDAWDRFSVTAYDCPRIPDEFLEGERQTLGDWWFRQEYLCEFVDTTDSLFQTRHIEAAFSADVLPLFGDVPPPAAPPTDAPAPQPLFV